MTRSGPDRDSTAQEAGATAHSDSALVWRRSPLASVGMLAAVTLAALGLLLSRPDVVALGIPLGVTTALALVRRPSRDGQLQMTLSARAETENHGRAGDGAVILGSIDVTADADWVQLAVDQGGRRTGLADVGSRNGEARTRSRLRHSGPTDLLAVSARAIAGDGVWISRPVESTELAWNASPRAVRLDRLPLAPRLTGLHGSHQGSRAGQGGDFRDIRAFTSGDELRRVDWRATARLARRPGELLVRRTDALSESVVVIVLDTADDLGEVVATWGSGDLERSGITSLDLGREAALSLATSAVEGGDRVAFHTLEVGGKTVRGGAGRRHLALLRDAIAAAGPSGEETRHRRTPQLPPGAIVFVLSTFFDGEAAQLTSRWHMVGHRVVAIDVLPVPDSTRLAPEQRTALRTLMAERDDVFADLRRTGVDVVTWGSGDVATTLRAVARVRR